MLLSTPTVRLLRTVVTAVTGTKFHYIYNIEVLTTFAQRTYAFIYLFYQKKKLIQKKNLTTDEKRSICEDTNEIL
jgi:hypothetical protein